MNHVPLALTNAILYLDSINSKIAGADERLDVSVDDDKAGNAEHSSACSASPSCSRSPSARF
jgi:hypothetical protein